MANQKAAPLKPQKKREAVTIGTSSVNRSDLEGLKAAWNHNQLVLFLGAGVSMAYGIPSWKNLVLEMLFSQTKHAARMRALFSNYRRALSSWLAEYFEYNPVILARMIEDDLRQRAKRKSRQGLPGGDSSRYCGSIFMQQQKRLRGRLRSAQSPISFNRASHIFQRSLRSTSTTCSRRN
jgi:hypothetical protein